MELTIYKKISVAASGSDTAEYIPTYRKMQLKEARLVADTAVTAHGSNHLVITLVNGSTTLATRDFSTGSGSSMAAGTAEALTLSGGSALDFEDLGELKLNYDQSGSGMAFDGGILLVFEPARDY